MEFEILYFFQESVKNDFLDKAMVMFTTLGNKGLVWIFIGALCVAFKKTRRIGVVTLLSLLLGMIVGNIILKPIVARQRPFTYDSSINLLITAPKDFSMPSGHTLSAVAASTAIFMFDKKYGVAAYALAFIIAISRLYLFVHFPTDILMGAFFGVTCALSVVFIERYITNKYFKPTLTLNRFSVRVNK